MSFQDNGNTGDGDVTLTYRIPPGGEVPTGAMGRTPTDSRGRTRWTPRLPLSGAGNDNGVANTDNRDVLIVGILPGTAGRALVGAIQELARLESTDD